MDYLCRPSRSSHTRHGVILISVIVTGCLVAGGPRGWAATDEVRDPFVFGPRASTQTQRATGPALNGVLWDAAKPFALVGDAMVGPGDTVSGWQVVEIQKTGLMVQRGERRAFIALGDAFPTD